ncbi:Prp18 domain-containing protein [Cryomyces antarcticus]
MDFASLMSAQISKAKPSTTSSSNEPSQKKYLKRSELKAQRQAAYVAEQKALETARIEKLTQKRKFEEDEALRNRERDEKRRRLAEESRRRREEEEDAEERARRKRVGLPELPPLKRDGESEGTPLPEGEEDVADEELVVKLREMNEPITLFGETHRQRLRRYWRLTGKESTPAPVLSTGPIPTTLVLVPESEMKVAAKVPEGSEGRKFLFRQLASYFTMVLQEWAVALAKRDESVKTSFQGKAAYNAMVQARDNMRPLFKRLEKGELEDGILEPVVEIVKAAQERRYVDANDGYLRLSIGKAAWPIGVTMVGIHERSAREKLHESDKGAAHIMSDEVTRKFLQSIKRCLSFAQTRWPPDDQLQLMG